MPALYKWPCVYLLGGVGVTGCSGSLYSFTAGNTKLGVFYVNFLGTFDQLYFHLGAWQSTSVFCQVATEVMQSTLSSV